MSLKVEIEKLKALLQPKPTVVFVFDATTVKEDGHTIWVVFDRGE